MMCSHLKPDGTRCRTTFGLSAEGVCFPHDPLRAVEFKAMQIARSEKSSERRKIMAETLPPGLPKAPKTLDDAVDWSSWAAHSVAAGTIDARTAHEIAVLVREFRMSLEKRDVLKEVEALRKQIDYLKRPKAA